jgi:hypothetical protein
VDVTGRDKVEAALSGDGAREIPVVICYEGIYIRDHWRQLTAAPWWVRYSSDVDEQLRWRREVIAGIGQDWFDLPAFPSRAARASLSIDARPEGIFQTDRRTRRTVRLVEEPVGGSHIDIHAAHPAVTPEAVGALIPMPDDRSGPGGPAHEPGRDDLAAALLNDCGAELFPIRLVGTPFELCVMQLWGFEQTMLNVKERPDLVALACGRFLAQGLAAVRESAWLGAAGIFIEDIFTDIISADAFARFALPYAGRLVEEIRQLGMKSIYYFCGNPAGKWDYLLDIGADALSLEESKKGFAIDIEEVVEQVNGRCAVLGNLDAVGVLQEGTEAQLRAEIERQIAAGRRNGDRFVMSLGSPVTPNTPTARVRLYCDLARELGAH